MATAGRCGVGDAAPGGPDALGAAEFVAGPAGGATDPDRGTHPTARKRATRPAVQEAARARHIGVLKCGRGARHRRQALRLRRGGVRRRAVARFATRAWGSTPRGASHTCAHRSSRPSAPPRVRPFFVRVYVTRTGPTGSTPLMTRPAASNSRSRSASARAEISGTACSRREKRRPPGSSARSTAPVQRRPTSSTACWKYGQNSAGTLNHPRGVDTPSVSRRIQGTSSTRKVGSIVWGSGDSR